VATVTAFGDAVTGIGSPSVLNSLHETATEQNHWCETRAVHDTQGTVSFRWERITARQALAALLDNYDLVMIGDRVTSAARITQKSDPERNQP